MLYFVYKLDEEKHRKSRGNDSQKIEVDELRRTIKKHILRNSIIHCAKLTG